jgi:hypothetical protein
MIPNLGATLAGFIVPAIWASQDRRGRHDAGRGHRPSKSDNILTPNQGPGRHLSGFFIIVAVTLFGALLGVLGALTAVPLAATVQIFVQELTKARREKVAAARAAAGSS